MSVSPTIGFVTAHSGISRECKDAADADPQPSSVLDRARPHPVPGCRVGLRMACGICVRCACSCVVCVPLLGCSVDCRWRSSEPNQLSESSRIQLPTEPKTTR
jgi:hypothetical protein